MCKSDKKFVVRWKDKKTKDSGRIPDQLFTRPEAISTVGKMLVLTQGIDFWYEPQIIVGGSNV
jgi:hypothetical protein